MTRIAYALLMMFQLMNQCLLHSEDWCYAIISVLRYIDRGTCDKITDILGY